MRKGSQSITKVFQPPSQMSWTDEKLAALSKEQLLNLLDNLQTQRESGRVTAQAADPVPDGGADTNGSAPRASAIPATRRGRRTRDRSQSPQGIIQDRSRISASDGWAALAASNLLVACDHRFLWN